MRRLMLFCWHAIFEPRPNRALEHPCTAIALRQSSGVSCAIVDLILAILARRILGSRALAPRKAPAAMGFSTKPNSLIGKHSKLCESKSRVVAHLEVFKRLLRVQLADLGYVLLGKGRKLML